MPAKVIPYAMASAQWGWRLPWRRVLRILWNWRWWPAVVAGSAGWRVAAGEVLYRDSAGDGLRAGLARVLKLAAAYLLAVGSWVLLLGWVATLFGRKKPPAEEVSHG